jgi:N-terminal region of Chorein or VPS13
LGKFSLSLHWLNLGNQPVQVLIEDLYILVVPRKEDGQDPNELERRIQEAKLERLDNAEVFQTQAAGVKGVNFCLHMIATNSRAFKAPTIALKVKALLHRCSENFLTTFK